MIAYSMWRSSVLAVAEHRPFANPRSWQDKVGMWLNPDEPPKDENGVVTKWMEGDVAKSLDKIGARPSFSLHWQQQ